MGRERLLERQEKPIAFCALIRDDCAERFEVELFIPVRFLPVDEQREALLEKLEENGFGVSWTRRGHQTEVSGLRVVVPLNSPQEQTQPLPCVGNIINQQKLVDLFEPALALLEFEREEIAVMPQQGRGYLFNHFITALLSD